jgi:hypothetical protein
LIEARANSPGFWFGRDYFFFFAGAFFLAGALAVLVPQAI